MKDENVKGIVSIEGLQWTNPIGPDKDYLV